MRVRSSRHRAEAAQALAEAKAQAATVLADSLQRQLAKLDRLGAVMRERQLALQCAVDEHRAAQEELREMVAAKDQMERQDRAWPAQHYSAGGRGR